MTAWDQLGLRRLSNGDYWRLCLERDGRRLRVQLGQAEGDHFVWGWEMILAPGDLAWMASDLTYAMAAAEAATVGRMQADAAIFNDMQLRLRALQEQTHGQDDDGQVGEDRGGQADGQGRGEEGRQEREGL
ncbi:hypothetical protein ABNQ39_00170 (plasmid) [Azospirillum sp. A26]|uniref:hypothetical protein n=1 Tax=Azospirillum sp. A26 TaxID=3160607 RepID=UPI00366F1ADA